MILQTLIFPSFVKYASNSENFPNRMITMVKYDNLVWPVQQFFDSRGSNTGSQYSVSFFVTRRQADIPKMSLYVTTFNNIIIQYNKTILKEVWVNIQ
jgi:hypothetical protein